MRVTVAIVTGVTEAVQEFRLQTHPYSVEFGRNSGAQIDVITKSGGNGYHGEGFEYYRGSALNSLNNIEKQSGLTRPARFNRNQFGGDIGGPVKLPHDNDRTFFFYPFQAYPTRPPATPAPTPTTPPP